MFEGPAALLGRRNGSFVLQARTPAGPERWQGKNIGLTVRWQMSALGDVAQARVMGQRDFLTVGWQMSALSDVAQARARVRWGAPFPRPLGA